jgi:hypothetical protein
MYLESTDTASNDEVERREAALPATKLIYPNHRSSPWLIEDAARDRSNRLLGATTSAPSNNDICNRRVHSDAQWKAGQESHFIERSALAKRTARHVISDFETRRRALQQSIRPKQCVRKIRRAGFKKKV